MRSIPLLRRVYAGACLLFIITAKERLAAQPAWRLVEQLRIGSADDAANALSGVRGVEVARDGRVFILDYAVQNVRIFSPAGALIKTIGRKGAGPGEFANANGIAFAPDGRLWVNDPANSRFAVFASDGQLITHHTVPIRSYGFLWDGHFDQRGRLNDAIQFFNERDRSSVQRIRRFAGDGTIIDTVAAPVCERRNPSREPEVFRAKSKTGSMGAQIPFMPSNQKAWDARGYVWCTAGDTYRIVQVGIEKHDTVRVIERQIDRVRVSAAERDSAIDRLKKQFARYTEVDADYSRIPEFKPAIVNLDIDDQGRLWVRRSSADTRTTTFDVLAPDGHVLAVATAPFRVPFYWHPIIRGDDLYTLVVDDDDVPFVVRARITRPGA